MCSHERQLVAGTETRNVADVGCSPFPGRDLPLQIVEQEWGKQLLLVASFPNGGLLLLLCSFSFLTALHSNLDFEQHTAGALSSVSLGRQISYKTFPPILFKSLTAAPLLPLSHSEPSAAVSGMCPQTAKPVSVHLLPLKKKSRCLYDYILHIISYILYYI